MIILDLIQGSNDWHETRAKYHTASEASAMMGASKNVSRNELIRMKATGDEKEYSQWVKEVLFERGKEVEELARPIVERFIGEALYPITALDNNGEYLASFDGVTLDETLTWECKQWNAEKADLVNQGIVPEEDYWQVVHQLLVSGAERAIYTVSDGSEDGTVFTTMFPTQDDFDKLIAGWKQFDEDVANYQHVEHTPTPEGKAPETLPTLRIEVMGMVTNSNLQEFKSTALGVIRSINKDLQTDEDFASADKTVKWCKEVESRLESAKDHALSQTASIDQLFRAIDEIKEEARNTRLDLEKLVDARKKAVRAEILQSGNDRLAAYIAGVNATLGGKIRLPAIPADFAGAMKGKKTVTSLRNAVDDELARAKIEASRVADVIRINLETLRTDARGFEALFPDAQQLVLKTNDDLKNLIATRLAEHKAAEEKRLEAERERIRQEEEAKARVVAPEAPIHVHAEAPSPTTVPDSAPARQTRLIPTRDEIVATLAQHYRTDPVTVQAWLERYFGYKAV